MELTKEEILCACQVAEVETKKRIERFRPKNAAKGSSGWICELSFHGSKGNELVFGVLAWWLACKGDERIYVQIHIKLQCIIKDVGRVLQFIGFHLAGEQCCGYKDRQVILAKHAKRRYPLDL